MGQSLFDWDCVVTSDETKASNIKEKSLSRQISNSPTFKKYRTKNGEQTLQFWCYFVCFNTCVCSCEREYGVWLLFRGE